MPQLLLQRHNGGVNNVVVPPTTAPERKSSPIGDYIQTKRLAAQLTQDQLADKVKFVQAAVSSWEVGARIPTAKAIAALARELPGAKVDEMLTLIEDQS